MQIGYISRKRDHCKVGTDKVVGEGNELEEAQKPSQNNDQHCKIKMNTK